jgi:hypothetical protein
MRAKKEERRVAAAEGFAGDAEASCGTSEELHPCLQALCQHAPFYPHQQQLAPTPPLLARFDVALHTGHGHASQARGSSPKKLAHSCAHKNQQQA